MGDNLPNELLMIVLKELLNVSSYKYMSSIKVVCKNWNAIIKEILPKLVQSTLRSKLLIEYDATKPSIRGITIDYDRLHSTLKILINNDKFEQVISNIAYFNDPNDIITGTVCANFHYENGPFIIEFHFGTLRLFKERNEIQSRIEWNHDDCRCIYNRDSNNPDSFVIQIKELTISLVKAFIIADLLNGSVDYDRNRHQYIIRRPVYSNMDLFSSVSIWPI